MRPAEKQRTSVFSEYENNENDSISSRQLEFWLKQTAPVQQRPVNEWTLMSTNSIFEEDQHPLMRNATFETINKENDFYSCNTQRPSPNTSAVLKSKSYLNAMVDLQQKVKQLTEENNFLKNSLNNIKDERNRSMSQSNYMAEELNHKIAVLEPKAKKLEETIKENKKLRDWKEENLKKLKLMEKMIKEYGERMAQYERQVMRLKEGGKSNDKISEQAQNLRKQLESTIEKLKTENLRLYEKNKVLEDMKEKSTTSILEKYSKSVNEIQVLTLQNDSLKRQVNILLNKNDEKSLIIDKYARMQSQVERLSTQNDSLKKEVKVLKERNEERFTLVENYNKSMNEAKLLAQQNESLKREIQKMQTKVEEKLAIQQKFNKSLQQIQSLTLDNTKLRKEISVLNTKNEEKIKELQEIHKRQRQSFLNNNEMQPIPFYETRSIIDKENDQDLDSKSQINQQMDSLHDNPQENIFIYDNKEKRPAHTVVKKSKHKLPPSKEQTSQKIKEKSQQKERSKSKSRERSKQRSRDNERNNQGSNVHSFILKSHEPLTHKEEPQYLYYTEQQAGNSTNTRKNYPYYWDSNQVADFGASQRGHQNNCNHNPQTSQFRLQQALLNEINREAVRLIEEQEKLVLNFSDEGLTPNERSQYNGRMKQLNEQIRVNHQKRLQIKQRMNEVG